MRCGRGRGLPRQAPTPRHKRKAGYAHAHHDLAAAPAVQRRLPAVLAAAWHGGARASRGGVTGLAQRVGEGSGGLDAAGVGRTRPGWGWREFWGAGRGRPRPRCAAGGARVRSEALPAPRVARRPGGGGPPRAVGGGGWAPAQRFPLTRWSWAAGAGGARAWAYDGGPVLAARTSRPMVRRFRSQSASWISLVARGRPWQGSRLRPSPASWPFRLSARFRRP